MSRSKKRGSDIQNPVKHYIQWAGKEGKLYIFDKSKGEKGERVFFKDLKFAVLDQLHTVTGFQKGRNGKGKGIYGTEVWDVKTEKMTVWVGGEKQAEDYYENLKGINGLKYAKNVYIAIFRTDGEVELGRITLTGSSFSGWLNFLAGKEEYKDQGKIANLYDAGILISGRTKQKTNGDTKYYEPKFSTFELTEEDEELLEEMDRELQNYLETRGKVERTTANQEVDEEEEEEEEDAPAPKPRKSTTTKRKAQPAEPEEDDEEYDEDDHEDAEDLEDLPF